MANGNQPATTTNKSNAAADGYVAPETQMAPMPTVGAPRFVRQTPSAPAFRFTGGPLGGPPPMAPQPSGFAPQAPQMGPQGFQAPQQGLTAAQLTQQYSPFGGGTPMSMAPPPAMAAAAMPGAIATQPPTAPPAMGYEAMLAPLAAQPAAPPELGAIERVAPTGEFGQVTGALVNPETGEEFNPNLPVETESGHTSTTGQMSEATQGGYVQPYKDTEFYHFNPADSGGLSNEGFEAYFGQTGGPNFVTGDEARWQASELGESREGMFIAQYQKAHEIQRRRLNQMLGSAGVAPGIGSAEQQQSLSAAFTAALAKTLGEEDIRVKDQYEGERTQNQKNIGIEIEAFIQDVVNRGGSEGMIMDVRLWRVLKDQESRFLNMGLDAMHVRQYLQALVQEWRQRTGEDEYQLSNEKIGTEEFDQSYSSSTASSEPYYILESEPGVKKYGSQGGPW